MDKIKSWKIQRQNNAKQPTLYIAPWEGGPMYCLISALQVHHYFNLTLIVLGNVMENQLRLNECVGEGAPIKRIE